MAEPGQLPIRGYSRMRRAMLTLRAPAGWCRPLGFGGFHAGGPHRPGGCRARRLPG